MSFSSEIKKEIIQVQVCSRHCYIALLSAFVYFSPRMVLDEEKGVLSFFCERRMMADFLKQIIETLFHAAVIVQVFPSTRKKNQNEYEIFIDNRGLIRDIIKMTSAFEKNHINPLTIKQDCCKRVFIRGVFLLCGSISDPEKTYHGEFVIANRKLAMEFSQILNFYDLNAKMIERKSSYVVYLKESDHIVDLLNIMGAHVCLMQFENVRIVKDVRNNLNRVVNCEAANIQKTAEASIAQQENILLIQNTKGLSYLPDTLREVAEIRLKYPESSLREIGALLSAQVSKSCVNHRLRKINEIADSIRGGL